MPHDPKALEKLWNHTDGCASQELTQEIKDAEALVFSMGDRRDTQGLDEAEAAVARLKQVQKDQDPDDIPKCDCGLEEAKELLKHPGHTRVQFDMDGRLEVLDLDRHTLILLYGHVNRKQLAAFHSKVRRADPRWLGRVFCLKPGEDVEHLPGRQTYAFYRSLMKQFNLPLHEAHCAAEEATKLQEAAEEKEQVELGGAIPESPAELTPEEAATVVPEEEMDLRKAVWEKGECVACDVIRRTGSSDQTLLHSCREADRLIPEGGDNGETEDKEEAKADGGEDAQSEGGRGVDEAGENRSSPSATSEKVCLDPDKMHGAGDQFPGTDEESHLMSTKEGLDDRMPGPTGPSGREPR